MAQSQTMYGASAVGLTAKRTKLHSVTYDGNDGADTTPQDDTTEYPCLIRAMDGGKIKFSTRVRASFLSHAAVSFPADRTR
jgi:hypothetical protein